MITVWSGAGTIIRTSRNMRGIIDHNRRFRQPTLGPDTSINVIGLMNGGAQFYIRWPDGSWSSNDFASRDVCIGFAQSRKFAGATISILPHQSLKAVEQS